MKPEVKQFFDEVFQYVKTKEPTERLAKVRQELGNFDTNFFILRVLGWHKQYFINMGDKEYCYMGKPNLEIVNRFFELCPVLQSVYILADDQLTWAEKMTETEKEEIRNYVHANYTSTLRITKRREK